MQTSQIQQMIKNSERHLELLIEASSRIRKEAEQDVYQLMVSARIADKVQELRSLANERCLEIDAEAAEVHRQIADLKAMMWAFTLPAPTMAYGIDLTTLDSATAALVRAGHLPTITQLGGNIEDAAQSEDYAVSLS
jgi:hypothetical protein